MFSRFLQTIIHAGAALAVFSVLATGMYYVMPVTTIGLVVCAVLAIGTTIGVTRRYPALLAFPETLATFDQKQTSWIVILAIASIASLGVWWSIVLSHPIVESVRSPWLVVPPAAVLAFFVPVISIAVLLSNKASTRAALPVAFGLTVLTLFSALSLAAAAYPLGYGFDPFLHRATIQYIAEHGTITPKPLYYIGEYVIELFAVKILHLPLLLVDVYLVPFLAATLIPAAIFIGNKQRLALALLFLPLAAFIQTTPQALAFVFTAAAVFVTPPLAVVFALAALAAHPIAGLPALFFVLLTYLAHKKHSWFIGATILSTIALPLAFTLQSLKAHLPLGFHLPTIEKLPSLPLSFFLGTHWSAWGDIAYLVIANFFLITVVLGLIGAYRSTLTKVPLICAGIAFANFLILGLFFDFPFLISYERADFAARMLTLTALFLLPYIPSAIEAKHVPRALAFMLLGILAVSSVYGAYPRYDAYAASAGFNVAQGDFEAVKTIDNYAAGREYVVLANQATSSAAISTLGFKKYYHGDVFFYPIPTGGELYQLFLTMAKTPDLNTIEKARELTGTDLVFFVMDDYWWDAKRVIEQTKPIATDIWYFGNGKTAVAVFE